MNTDSGSRRDAILQAARRTLAEDAAASVAVIAADAGVSRATFYRYFASRAALLDELDIDRDPGTRERVLAAALELLARDGLARLSVDDVADRAGVSRASVYRLYPGKSALFGALLAAESPFVEISAALRRMGDRPPDEVLPVLLGIANYIADTRLGVVRALMFEVSTGTQEAVEAAQALLPMLGDITHYFAAPDGGRHDPPDAPDPRGAGARGAAHLPPSPPIHRGTPPRTGDPVRGCRRGVRPRRPAGPGARSHRGVAMHGRRRIIVPVVLLAVVILAAGVWYASEQAATDGALTASGTVEATGISIAPEVSGRVAEVTVVEGDTVAEGDVLVRLDATLLEAQRGQAEAALATAQAAVDTASAAAGTARANLAAVGAGPSAEQVAVARRQLEQAQRAYEVARDGYADLSRSEKDTPAGIAAKAQRDNAKAAVATARAQYELAVAGARPEQVAVAQAQVDAAEAQVDAARTQVRSAEAALAVLDAQLGKLTLAAPAAGTVLMRSIEPGEVVMPGAVLLVVGDLDRLTVTVYVPEDRLGEVAVGQPVRVTVDAFPGESFAGTVERIADQAEFTPRNVQTVEGRKTTVFAVDLALDASGGKLKPGMPADVGFGT